MIRVPVEGTGRLPDAWRHCVGTGRLELALRRDYQDSLKLLQDEIGFRYIRGHGLLSDGMGVHRPYEWEGVRRVHHSFTYVDQFATPRERLKGTRLAELPVHITEFNSSYRPDNPVHDTAFHAAYLAPVLATGGDHVDSFSYWTFSDMFEEAGPPTALFHGGFGLLTHRQVKKPTYHLYAFMARMGEKLLRRGDDHLVTRHPDGRVTALVWAPVDASGETPGPSQRRLRLSVPVKGAREAFVRRSVVDEEHGNARTAWQRMGSPRSPRPDQLDVLHEAAEPARQHLRLPVEDGRVALDLTLSRHEVTLVEVSAVVDEAPPWTDERRLLGREAR